MTESTGRSTKVITVRLPHDDAGRAEFVARVEGISVNEVFRRALDGYLGTLRADPDFVTRAKAQLARDNKIAGQLV
jgi:hypothetical protein